MPRRYIWGVSSLLELRLLWTLEYLNQVCIIDYIASGHVLNQFVLY